MALAEHGITFHEYHDRALAAYGNGYLLYLPDGYAAGAQQDWPLIVFLIGSAERGDDPYSAAIHGPLKMVLREMRLPFVVAAPLLKLSPAFRSFPEAYLDGALDEVLAQYRVDRSRVYLTGISMGGEATYRFALYRPEAFAAIAPLAGFDARFDAGVRAEGFVPFSLPPGRIKDIPVWAFHGADDPLVPLAAGQQTAEEFRRAGVNITFTVLPGRGLDVWTDTYADPAFYTWLLDHVRGQPAAP